MEKSRTVFHYLHQGWVVCFVIFALFTFSDVCSAGQITVVKDLVWFRKVKYKDAIFYFIKNDPQKRIVFVRNGKKISYRLSEHNTVSIDYQETSNGFENLIFAKKRNGLLKVGFLKKPLAKYYMPEERSCQASRVPFLMNYQLKDIRQFSSDGIFDIWDKSNCNTILGGKYGDIVAEKLKESFDESKRLVESCFSSVDLREKFAQSSASLDFSFKFIASFESMLSSVKDGGAELSLRCDADAPQLGELASLDKTRKPRVLTLNVHNILKPGSADINLGEAVDKVTWSAFHEFGHDGVSLPLIPSSDVNCIDEDIVSKLTLACRSGAKTFDLKAKEGVEKCIAVSKLDLVANNADANLVATGQDRIDIMVAGNNKGVGGGATNTALVSSQQTAQLIAQNANAEMFAPAPTTALDTLANETLATTSGSLAGNRERPIIATPKYEAALESTYNYFSGVSNTTSNLMAQALLPQAQAAQVTAQNGTGYAVQGGGKSNTATVASLPANVQIYQPAQYIADLTCPTDNCTPSPALVAAYNVNSGASNRLATSSGTDGNLTNPTLAVENNKTQGKFTETGSQQIGPNLAQGKLDSSSAPADSVQSVGAPGKSGIAPSGGGSAPAPTRSVAAVGGSQPVARTGAVTRGDSEALQILATASERLGGKYLQQIRSQYSDPNFNQQLANRGWSIQVYDGKVLKRQMGATTGIQEQFIDNGKELVRKKSGK